MVKSPVVITQLQRYELTVGQIPETKVIVAERRLKNVILYYAETATKTRDIHVKSCNSCGKNQSRVLWYTSCLSCSKIQGILEENISV